MAGGELCGGELFRGEMLGANCAERIVRKPAITLGIYLGACNVQMMLTAAGSEGSDLVHFPR